VSARSVMPIVAVVVASVVTVGGTLGVLMAIRPADAAAPSGSPGTSPVAAVEAEQATPQESATAAATPRAPETPGPSGVAIDVAGLLPDGPVEPSAIRSGFADSPYTFTATVTGFPSYAAMGATWTGTVRDATHYNLEFPAGASLTRYQRAGKDRTAYLGDLPVTVAAGDGSMRTPDDLLPMDLYASVIEPWTVDLPASPRGDSYIAKPDQLTSTARGRGLDANRWALTVAVDPNGRLTSAVFTGYIRSRRFRMELLVTYLDQGGAEYGRAAKPAFTPPPTPTPLPTPLPTPGPPAVPAVVATPGAAGSLSLVWGPSPAPTP
jgi:hypothetical protein